MGLDASSQKRSEEVDFHFSRSCSTMGNSRSRQSCLKGIPESVCAGMAATTSPSGFPNSRGHACWNRPPRVVGGSIPRRPCRGGQEPRGSERASTLRALPPSSSFVQSRAESRKGARMGRICPTTAQVGRPLRASWAIRYYPERQAGVGARPGHRTGRQRCCSRSARARWRPDSR